MESPILFEPWSLGDTLIALAALQELPVPVALACDPRWHGLLRTVRPKGCDLTLIPVSVAYTSRQRGHAFDTGQPGRAIPTEERFREVLSIRGDFRDYLAARRLFPQARIVMNGWVRFWARKSAVINFPFARGWIPVENRYLSWAKMLGVSLAQIEARYRQQQAGVPRNGRVAIHLGAQWGSKQFPEAAALKVALAKVGYAAELLAHPQDRLPPGVAEAEVIRTTDQDLVARLRSAEYVITNDSGPLHLAAFLGCRTVALVRTSPMEEWCPPGVEVVASPVTPIGYRPDRRYMTDGVLPGWPSCAQVLARLTEMAPKTASPVTHEA